MDTPETPSVDTPSPKSKSVVSVFKEPPSPATLTLQRRRPRQKVLDEDRYVEKVSRIIARDFFPELEKLEAQREFIEAKERNDVAAMSRLRERFSSTSGSLRHGQGGQSGRPGSPDTFETPLEERREEQEPGSSSKAGANDDAKSVASSSSSSAQGDANKGPGLDTFLSKHTSEDNESFNEIMEESRQKFEFTHSWMFKEDEQKSIEMKSQQLALPSIEDQCNRDKKSDKISRSTDGWTYRNENAVFYPPEGVDPTPEELVERARKERKIVHENTRFRRDPWKSDLRDSSLKETVASKKEKEAGKVGVDGRAFQRPETPAVNGFKILRMTPSPMPGAAAESPFMTWGEVESTPYRLEGCETPIPGARGGAGGPSFSIQDVPKRDRLAHELAEKNSKFYRDRKGKAIQNARSHIRTPKMNLTERVSTMSPAAQRLATNKLGIRLGTDKALRASYTPSPARTPGGSSSTPSRSKLLISSSVRSKGGATPRTPRTPSASASASSAAAAAAASSGDLSLTDNLLNLPSSSSSSSQQGGSSGGESDSKRQKASDYF